jgi:hypothetical protein
VKPIVGNWAEFHVITDPRDNIIIIIIIIITQCIKAETQLLIRRKQWKSEFVIKRTL